MSEQKEKPSKEQIVAWYKEEIELAELRAILSKHQRDAAVYEAERINAIGAIAQMTQEPKQQEDSSAKTMRPLRKEPHQEQSEVH
jgi:hypothetical protein